MVMSYTTSIVLWMYMWGAYFAAVHPVHKKQDWFYLHKFTAVCRFVVHRWPLPNGACAYYCWSSAHFRLRWWWELWLYLDGKYMVSRSIWVFGVVHSNLAFINDCHHLSLGTNLSFWTSSIASKFEGDDNLPSHSQTLLANRSSKCFIMAESL